MKTRFFHFLILILLSSFAYAAENREHDLLKPIQQYYTWLNSHFAGQPKLSDAALQKNLNNLFTKNAAYRINSKLVAVNITNLVKRFSSAQHTLLAVSMPFDEVVVDSAKNKVAVRYHGESATLQKSVGVAIFTIHDGKINQLNEVVMALT